MLTLSQPHIVLLKTGGKHGQTGTRPTNPQAGPPSISKTLKQFRLAEEIRLAIAASLAETEAMNTNAQGSRANNPPGPPNTPAPTAVREPAPPPAEPHHDDEHHTDANGITTHMDGWRYKVTVTCKCCSEQYKTQWGVHHEPYEEIEAAGWTKGRDSSGNWTWQRAHCPRFRYGCARI